MPANEPHEHAALTRYWDDLLHHRTPRPDGLDPLLTATVQRLHALDDAPAPSPAFARHLREELVASTSRIGAGHPPLHVVTAPNGRTALGVASQPTRRRPSPKRWWPPLEFAAAITLLVTLLGGYFAGGRVLPLLTGSSPTEEAVPPTEIGTTNLMSLDIDAVPGNGPVAIRLWRFTIQPDSEWGSSGWQLDESSITYPVLFGYYVERGTMDLGILEPWASSDASARYVVQAGQALNVVGMSLPMISNAGPSPLVVLQIGIYRGWMPVMPSASGVGVVDLGGGVVDPWPAERVRLTIDRAVVAAGEGIAGAEGGSPLLLSVEHGWLGLSVERGQVELPNLPTVSGDETPVPSMPPADSTTMDPTATPNPIPDLVAAGSDVTLEAGEAVFVPADAAVADLRNAWSTPLSALIVRLDTEVQGTEAKAFDSPPIEVLASWRFDAPPGHQPFSIVLRRLTLEPGASFEYPFSGTARHAVESGAAAISLGGGEEAVVDAGQEHHATGRGPIVIRNAGSTPVEIIQVLPGTGDCYAEDWSGTLFEGVSATLLGCAIADLLPSGQYDLTLSRVTLPGPIGQSMLPVRNVPLELVAVDSGTLAVTPMDDSSRSRIGAETLLTAGDSSLFQRDTSYSARNPNDLPVTALLLTLTFAPESWRDDPDTRFAGVASPVVPSDTECQVAPRSVEDLQRLYALPQSDLAKADPGLYWATAWGIPANSETVAGVTATMREAVACRNAGQELRVYALYSDNGIQVEAWYRGPGWFEILEDNGFTWPGFLSRDVFVTDVREYDDGRASAWVLSGDQWDFVTFVRAGDRWLIDAVYGIRG